MYYWSLGKETNKTVFLTRYSYVHSDTGHYERYHIFEEFSYRIKMVKKGVEQTWIQKESELNLQAPSPGHVTPAAMPSGSLGSEPHVRLAQLHAMQGFLFSATPRHGLGEGAAPLRAQRGGGGWGRNTCSLNTDAKGLWRFPKSIHQCTGIRMLSAFPPPPKKR